MKKFLSICLVALCSVSAMYAQTNSQSNVSCDKKVKVTANSTTGYYHFVEWKIKNGSDVLLTVDKNGTKTPGQSNTDSKDYGADVSVPSVDALGVETSTLTLDPLGGDLINAVALGTVTFEAVFDEDSYKILGTSGGGGEVSITSGVDANGDAKGQASVVIEATADNCSTFDHWEAVGNTNDPNHNSTNPTLSFTTPATWEHGSTHEYKAIFKTKTVNVNAISSNTNMGTVTLTIEDSNTNQQ